MCVHVQPIYGTEIDSALKTLLLISYSSSITAILTCNLILWQVFLSINATEKPALALWVAIPGDSS